MEGVPSGNNYQGGFGTQLMAKVSSMSPSLLFFFFQMQMFNLNQIVFFWALNRLQKLISDKKHFMSVAGLKLNHYKRKKYCTGV